MIKVGWRKQTTTNNDPLSLSINDKKKLKNMFLLKKIKIFYIYANFPNLKLYQQ